MRKIPLYSEIAYFLGMALLAIGTAFIEAADFGISMVVAPAYIIHLKVSQFWSFLTFGRASWMLQGLLLLVIFAVMRRFRLSYLFSFVTAVIYGFFLDTAVFLVSSLGIEAMFARLIAYSAGVVICCAGLAFLFRTYIPPEVYDLFVKELSARFRIPLPKFKLAYDCTSCAVAVALSFIFFGRLDGVGIGTIVCALVNGPLIGVFSGLYEKHIAFRHIPRLHSLFSA